jgi:hypothetical protein
MSEARHSIARAAGGPSRRFLSVVIAITLFGGSMILYGPSLGFGFIGYDEDAVLLGHPNLYAQPSLAGSAREILTGYFPREEPLLVRDLSWLVDARVFGFTNPVGYHLGNILLNAVDVVLLFLFLLHATRSLPFASLTAALFAALAIHVEPVCWAMGRKDVLGAFFTLLALLFQSVALREPRRPRRLALHALVFLLCPFAILSKFSAIILTPLLAVHRLFAPFLDRTRRPSERLDLRSRWRELAAFVPHLVVTAGLYFWYQRQLSAFQVIGDRGPPPLSFQHMKTLALLVPLSLARTLGHIAVAAELSISYLRPNVGLPLLPGEIACIIITVLGSTAALWLTLRYRKDLAFFVLAFFLFMLPYFNIEYIGIWVADRYAYLSSFCVVALVSALTIDGWRSQHARDRRLGAMLLFALAVLGGLGLVAGRKHQQAFRDAHAFWNYELHLAQPSMLAFDSYAKTRLGDAALAEAGSPARRQAIEGVLRAAEDGIRYYHALPWQPAPGYFSRERAHLASLYSALGHAATLAESTLEARLGYFQRAYQIMPNRQTALMLAQVLLDMARRAPAGEQLARESLSYFQQYLRQASSDPLRRPGLGRLLSQYTEAFPTLASDVSRIAEEILK